MKKRLDMKRETLRRLADKDLVSVPGGTAATGGIIACTVSKAGGWCPSDSCVLCRS